MEDRRLVPLKRGIYGWWFEKPPVCVPLRGVLQRNGRYLLYVGIAPRRPSRAGTKSKSTLRNRLIKNHIRGTLGGSTLRRTLATLLSSELDLHITRRRGSKPVMPGEDEAKLTDWMASHASISFLTHDQPWDLETALLADGAKHAVDSCNSSNHRTPALPLNIAGSNHPFAKTLSQWRSNIR